MYDETRLANQDADSKAFTLVYKIALWEADVKKKGNNPGGNLGEVDLSFISGTDVEENSGEDSDSSEDQTKAIRNDLERQKQVTPSTSPLQNKYFAGFMKSSGKQQSDAPAKQAPDEDSISLPSSYTQADNGSSAEKQGQRTGDVTGHGGSMSVQHGSLSPALLDDTHVANLQSVADGVRKGSSLSSSQATDAERINFDAPSQVDSSRGTLMSDEPKVKQGSMIGKSNSTLPERRQ